MSITMKKKRISFPASRLPYPGKIHCLASASCPGFFPADIIFEGGMIHLTCNVQGFRPLKDCRGASETSLLSLLKEVIKNMLVCMDWMWFPEDYVLSPDTVWLNESGNVRFLCIPDSSEISPQRRLSALLHGMQQMNRDMSGEYLHILRNFLDEEDHTPERILAEIDQLLIYAQSYSSFPHIK